MTCLVSWLIGHVLCGTELKEGPSRTISHILYFLEPGVLKIQVCEEKFMCVRRIQALGASSPFLPSVPDLRVALVWI